MKWKQKKPRKLKDELEEIWTNLKIGREES